MKSAKGSSRIPAVEVLRSTPLIRDYILHEDKTKNPRRHRRRHFAIRHETFDQSLFYLYQSGLIALDEALRGRPTPMNSASASPGSSNTSMASPDEMEQVSGVSSLQNIRSDSISRLRISNVELKFCKYPFFKVFRRFVLDTNGFAR